MHIVAYDVYVYVNVCVYVRMCMHGLHIFQRKRESQVTGVMPFL